VLLTLRIKYKDKNRTDIDKNIKDNLLSYIKKKKLRIPYFVASGVEIWWSLIYIYMPLFIIKSGVGEEVVGIFLSLIIIPLILFEYKASVLSENLGFKKFLVGGFFLLGICAIFAFFSTNIYLTLAIIIVASFGMAIIEPLQDSFFFRKVKSNEEEKYYPIFATSGNIGSFIGKFCIAGVLLILPDKFAYLTIAVFMFAIGYSCLKIKEHRHNCGC
jgi:MFS family permease